MWLQRPDNTWVESSFRHPEQLVELAPVEFQCTCVRAGGRNIYARPNFRLVWNPSRYTMAGGHEVQFWDQHGNFTTTRPETVLVSRYVMPWGWENCWVLEAWRPAEWYAAQAWEQSGIDWSQTKGVRRMDPIPSQGGYEALELSLGQPVPFFARETILPNGRIVPRATPIMVEWAICRYRQTLDASVRQRMAAMVAAREKQREQARNKAQEEYREILGPHPFVPWSGATDKARGAN